MSNGKRKYPNKKTKVELSYSELTALCTILELFYKEHPFMSYSVVDMEVLDNAYKTLRTEKNK